MATTKNVTVPRVLKPMFMWAGGKTRLLAKFEPFFPKKITTYVEPFLGGAAVFAHLHQRVDAAILCDVNAELIGVYNAIKSDVATFKKEFTRLEANYIPLDKENRKKLYYQLRKEYWTKPDSTETQALLLFLMKTGFNGIWQSCEDAKGKFATPAGLLNQKTEVMDKALMDKWNVALTNAKLVSGSYDTLDIPDGSFIYCDPPYRDSFTTYDTGFNDKDLEKLVRWCQALHKDKGCTVWLSNREAGDTFFEDLAPEAKFEKFPITYTAGRRKKNEDASFSAKKATELLIRWQK